MKNRRAKGFAEDRIKNFWSKVNKTESCWLWTGYKQKNGYGRYGTGGNRSAHRIAYQLVKGAYSRWASSRPFLLRKPFLCKSKSSAPSYLTREHASREFYFFVASI